jgi:hypothetical protein
VEQITTLTILNSDNCMSRLKFLGLTSDMAIIDGGVSSILSFSSCNFVCVRVSALVNKMLKLPQEGVCCYMSRIHSNTPPYNFKDTQFEEHLFCEVDTGQNEKILIGSLHRSPSGTDNNFEQWCKIFKESKHTPSWGLFTNI